MMTGPAAMIASILLALLLPTGCGGSDASRSDTSGVPTALLQQSRPIGRGPRFQPRVQGEVVGPCRASFGRRHGVHVELFAADRVVIVARGIGVCPALSFSGGRIVRARCYGDLVTVEPTGVVLVRDGTLPHLRDLFRAWGQPLSRTRLASFTAPSGGEVIVFVGGRRWGGMPGDVPLREHSEIVLEVGPYVPPHPSYTFPPGT